MNKLLQLITSFGGNKTTTNKKKLLDSDHDDNLTVKCFYCLHQVKESDFTWSKFNIQLVKNQNESIMPINNDSIVPCCLNCLMRL